VNLQENPLNYDGARHQCSLRTDETGTGFPKGKRKESLWHAAFQVFSEDFNGRMLSFSTDTARPYAQIVVERAREGRPISAFDAQIAAIAATHGATVVTRNISDFELCGIDIINPWKT